MTKIKAASLAKSECAANTIHQECIGGRLRSSGKLSLIICYFFHCFLFFLMKNDLRLRLLVLLRIEAVFLFYEDLGGVYRVEILSGEGIERLSENFRATISVKSINDHLVIASVKLKNQLFIHSITPIRLFGSVPK
jgi:hypothetical protein